MRSFTSVAFPLTMEPVGPRATSAIAASYYGVPVGEARTPFFAELLDDLAALEGPNAQGLRGSRMASYMSEEKGKDRSAIFNKYKGALDYKLEVRQASPAAERASVDRQDAAEAGSLSPGELANEARQRRIMDDVRASMAVRDGARVPYASPIVPSNGKWLLMDPSRGPTNRRPNLTAVVPSSLLVNGKVLAANHVAFLLWLEELAQFVYGCSYAASDLAVLLQTALQAQGKALGFALGAGRSPETAIAKWLSDLSWRVDEAITDLSRLLFSFVIQPGESLEAGGP